MEQCMTGDGCRKISHLYYVYGTLIDLVSLMLVSSTAHVIHCTQCTCTYIVVTDFLMPKSILYL